MTTASITKSETARRQLDVAIALLFAKEDIVAIHTLAEAASDIAADLEKDGNPYKTWDFHTPMVCGLDEDAYFALMRESGKFIKQPDGDLDAGQEMTISDTPTLLARTIFKLGEFSQRLSVSQSIYLLWFLACHQDSLDPAFAHTARLRPIFGNLSRRTMDYRLTMGRQILLDEMQKIMQG